MSKKLTLAELTTRVVLLELEVAKLKRCVSDKADSRPWWKMLAGNYANDPVFDEVVALGREYRESLRPGAKKKPRRTKRRK
jgi:hypothetical protein